MKLHIHGNSLRLSISETDLARLRWEGFLERWMGLGPGKRFTYRIETGPEDRDMCAVLQGDALTILMPQERANAWLSGDEPRFEAMQMIDGDQHLHIVVEKELNAPNGRVSKPVANSKPVTDETSS